MQKYKIRIPNAETNRQIVLDKAYSLGCRWHGSPITEFMGAANKLYLSRGNITYGESDVVFESFDAPEISYQDFLRLGEFDVNNCKIRLPKSNYNALVDLNNKLISLGIKGYSLVNQYVPINHPVRDLWGRVLTNTDYNDQNHPEFMFIRNGKTSMVGLENYFNQLPEREVSIEQIMQLEQSTINNTTTQIMSEVTLKCIRQPQRARNITVDREYTGILIDSEDTQVDSWDEAEFFQCVNNNSLEAKYKLSLFEEPAAPVIPKITMTQLLERLRFNRGSIVLPHNGEDIEILNGALGYLTIGTVNCSCGIHSLNGIDEFWDEFVDGYEPEWKDQISAICEDPNFREIEDFVIAMTVKSKIDAISTAMVMLSTTNSRTELCDLMDKICEDRNGWITDYITNPNSSNQIKAWLIPKL